MATELWKQLVASDMSETGKQAKISWSDDPQVGRPEAMALIASGKKAHRILISGENGVQAASNLDIELFRKMAKQCGFEIEIDGDDESTPELSKAPTIQDLHKAPDSESERDFLVRMAKMGKLEQAGTDGPPERDEHVIRTLTNSARQVVADLKPFDPTGKHIWGDRGVAGRWPVAMTTRTKKTESRQWYDADNKLVAELITPYKLPAPEHVPILDWLMDRFVHAVFDGYAEPPYIPVTARATEIWHACGGTGSAPGWFYATIDEALKRAARTNIEDHSVSSRRPKIYHFCEYVPVDGRMCVLPGSYVWRRLLEKNEKGTYAHIRSFPFQTLLKAGRIEQRNKQPKGSALRGKRKRDEAGAALFHRFIRVVQTYVQPTNRTRPIPLATLMRELPLEMTSKKASEKLKNLHGRAIEVGFLNAQPVIGGRGCSKTYEYDVAYR